MRRMIVAINLYRDRVLNLKFRACWRIAKDIA